jgi:hypothetical protein
MDLDLGDDILADLDLQPIGVDRWELVSPVTKLRRPARDPWCPTPKGSEDRLDSANFGDC